MDFLRNLLNYRIKIDKKTKISVSSTALLLIAIVFAPFHYYVAIGALVLLLIINFWFKTGFWKIVLVIVLLASLFVGINFVKDKIIVTNEPANISQYLKNKYKEEFVVKSVKIDNSWECDTTSMDSNVKAIVAEAYPIRNNKLVFKVYKCLKKEPSLYKDNYTEITWGNQEKDKVGQFLATVFDKVPDFEVDISAIYPFDLASYIHGTPPDFLTFWAQHKKDIDYGIQININDDNFIKNQSTHKSNAYKIVEYLRKTDFIRPALSYQVTVKSQGKIYICGQRDNDDPALSDYNAKSPDDMNFQESYLP